MANSFQLIKQCSSKRKKKNTNWIFRQPFPYFWVRLGIRPYQFSSFLLDMSSSQSLMLCAMLRCGFVVGFTAL